MLEVIVVIVIIAAIASARKRKGRWKPAILLPFKSAGREAPV